MLAYGGLCFNHTFINLQNILRLSVIGDKNIGKVHEKFIHPKQRSGKFF